MKKQIKILIPLFLIITAFFGSCKTAPPYCVNPLMKDLTIRWGNSYSNHIIGYELYSTAKFNRITSTENKNEVNKIYGGKISNEDYCNLIRLIREKLLKTQALNVPTDTFRFVDYINPKTGMNQRSLWNPKFKTVGSKGFREVYDSLQTVVSRLEKTN